MCTVPKKAIEYNIPSVQKSAVCFPPPPATPRNTFEGLDFYNALLWGKELLTVFKDVDDFSKKKGYRANGFQIVAPYSIKGI